MGLQICAICEMTDGVLRQNTRISQREFIYCPRCGEYYITIGTAENWQDHLKEQKVKKKRLIANASGWIRENQKSEIALSNLVNIQTPTFQERTDKLLLGIEKKTDFAGKGINIDLNEGLGIAWGWDYREIYEMLIYMKEINRIKWTNTKQGPPWENIVVAPEGWAHLEKLRQVNPDSPYGFIAISFSSELNQASDAINKAIKAAGYKPERVDSEPHTDKIDDRIIAMIRRSRFVVADFTKHSQGVYYEAGFAFGLNIQVFQTCKKQDMEKLHFDIRQNNTIDWETPEELETRLIERIKAILGEGNFHSDES